MKRDGNPLENGQGAAILLRDPAINVLAMTQHPELRTWIDKNEARLNRTDPGYFDAIVRIAHQAFA